jgi:hypothetical protein
VKAIGKFYLAKRKLDLKKGETLEREPRINMVTKIKKLLTRAFNLRQDGIIECELGNCSITTEIQRLLGQYSYELVDQQFSKSDLISVLSEIASEVDSERFSGDYRSLLIADFAAAAKGAVPQSDSLPSIVSELIGELIEIGHDPNDLLALGQQLVLSNGRPADKRFEDFVSNLRAGPRQYTTITSFEDVQLEDDRAVEIGSLVLRGQKHDFSPLLEKIESSSFPPEYKDFLKGSVNPLANKVSVEMPTMNFGPGEAREVGAIEISKAVDVLSIQDPNVLIIEPRERKQSRMIVLDSSMLPVQVSAANRLELYGKNLDSESLTELELILQAIRPILVKPAKQLTEFERRILTGMHFYRKGNSAFDSVDKVVNYVVSLESMLVMRGERPSTTLPRRVLEVLSVGIEYRPLMRKALENAYHHRGEILHSGVIDKRESDRVAAELRELNRRLLGIITEYTGRPSCDTLRQFIEMIERDTITKREAMLSNVLLEINRDYSGKGVLKKSDGSPVGDVEFTLSCKDDGRYVYIIGSMKRFNLTGSITDDRKHYVEATFDGVSGSYKLSLSAPFNPKSLIRMLGGQLAEIPFKVQEMLRM